MTVADLKQHLTDLAKLLDAAGGRQVAKDFALMAEGLTPFAGQSLAEFTRLLALAHEYRTTGKLTPPPKAARAAKLAKAKTDPAAVAAALRALYDRAGDPALPLEQINAELGQLAGLTKPGLLIVAERMELAGLKAKKVDDIKAAIRQKVLDRRSSAQRGQLMEAPPAAGPHSPDAAGP
jgi:hypothetical protein